MKTLREKVTFILTVLVYLLFHLRLDQNVGIVFKATFQQIYKTAPISIGLTYLVVLFIRHASGGVWPPWDRIFRIFFTLGIIFAFIIALFEYLLGPGWEQIITESFYSSWLGQFFGH